MPGQLGTVLSCSSSTCNVRATSGRTWNYNYAALISRLPTRAPTTAGQTWAPTQAHTSCARAGNLSALTSPLSASTRGMPSTFSGCGGDSAYMFFVVVPPHATISIGQTANSFDSSHAVMWSESCPTAYSSSTSGNSCKDDPDTATETRTNTGSTPRKLWFVVRGYASSESGSFTLGWLVQPPPSNGTGRESFLS